MNMNTVIIETQNNYSPFESPLRESAENMGRNINKEYIELCSMALNDGDDSSDDLKRAFELQKRKEDK